MSGPRGGSEGAGLRGGESLRPGDEDAAALAPGVRALVAVSAALASRDRSALRTALERAEGTARADDVEEVLLQSYLFLGFPAVLGAFELWRDVSGRSAPPASEAGGSDWADRGERTCREVYGEQYEALRENVRALHPELDRWMVEEGYGKVLGRPGVALPVRELCVAALLAVLHDPVPLYSHLRGALRAGAGVGDVEAALAVADRHMSDEARRSARSSWERVRDRANA